jgi:hypothetical protein
MAEGFRFNAPRRRGIGVDARMSQKKRLFAERITVKEENL